MDLIPPLSGTQTNLLRDMKKESRGTNKEGGGGEGEEGGGYGLIVTDRCT
jgi:hypothetical protein